MPIQGNPRSFHKRFKYIVEIDGFASAGFQKCSELSMEVGKVEYREGGSLIPNKSPGLLNMTDVTLERGATTDLELYTWFKEVAYAASGLGLKDEEYKRDFDIVQQDRDGSEQRRWNVTKGWPTKFVAGDWDNDAEEVNITSVTVTFDFFDTEG